MEPAPPSANSPEPAARNPFFPLVLISTSIFILTILAMVAVIFSDPNAPVVRFFDAHATRLIIAEVVVILIVGFLALVVDRLQTRRQRAEREASKETSSPADPLKKS